MQICTIEIFIFLKVLNLPYPMKVQVQAVIQIRRCIQVIFLARSKQHLLVNDIVCHPGFKLAAHKKEIQKWKIQGVQETLQAEN